LTPDVRPPVPEVPALGIIIYIIIFIYLANISIGK
jgi:hypothetical protein